MFVHLCVCFYMTLVLPLFEYSVPIFSIEYHKNLIQLLCKNAYFSYYRNRIWFYNHKLQNTKIHMLTHTQIHWCALSNRYQSIHTQTQIHTITYKCEHVEGNWIKTAFTYNGNSIARNLLPLLRAIKRKLYTIYVFALFYFFVGFVLFYF